MTLEQPLATRPPAGLAEAAEAHLDDVYGYLLYLTRDRETAEDLASSTFEKALRMWSRFDPQRGSARTWLLGIARTTALDWFRSESRRRRREVRFRESVGEVADDRRDLGDHLAAMLDCRDLSHRVDRQVRLGLHRAPIVEDFGIVGRSDLFEHPAHGLPARLGIGVEDEVGHGCSPARMTSPP